MPEETPALVELRGVTKSFYGVVANHAVDFDVRAGEIHALLGENGAGKSTLMNIMAGIYQPDIGDIYVDGVARKLLNPLEAIGAGIGMVYQHFKLVSAFTVAENIHLGWNETPLRTTPRALERRTAAFAERFKLEVNPSAKVRDLSAGEQQRVEILKVLVRGARVLVLDEPTAVLTPAEAARLMKALREFRASGKAVVLISHKLGEVLDVADRITVLRTGRVTAIGDARSFTVDSLAHALIGTASTTPQRQTATRSPDPRLRLRGVDLKNHRGLLGLAQADLDIYGGEIIGIAGVAGNGQLELSEVLTGLRPPECGEMVIDGRKVETPTPLLFAKSGIGHIPEDRLKTSIAPTLDISRNAAMREYNRGPICRGPWLNPPAMRRLAKDIIAAAKIVAASPSKPIGDLSGGNQQRLVVCREMRIATRALIAAYPTRGLDIGAAQAMQQYLLDLRAAGVGIVLISEDLDEIFSLADRIAVVFKGSISRIFDRESIDRETIGLLMGGERSRVNECAAEIGLS